MYLYFSNEGNLMVKNQIKRLMAYHIHMLRLMRGYTQQDVAGRLRKSTNAVSNWELGNTSPSIDDLMELCKMFDVTPNQICGWDECPELIDYINQSENAAQIVEDLKKQKQLIEEQIETYAKFMNRK